jgi:hypothetical protein
MGGELAAKPDLHSRALQHGVFLRALQHGVSPTH